MRKSNPPREAAKAPAQSTPLINDSLPQLDGMMAEERRTQILQILHAHGRVKVDELKQRAQERACEFLIKNFRNWQIQIFWGSASDFCTELRNRLDGSAT